MKNFFYILGMVFLAELADKTQLTVFGFSAGSQNRVTVFVASSLALVLSTFLAVVAGDFLSQWVSQGVLETSVGCLFVALGIWFIYGALG